MMTQIGHRSFMQRVGQWGRIFLTGGGISISLAMPQAAQAHGVVLQHQPVAAQTIIAQYETGEPMANAQITVYAPNGDSPWLQGTTDQDGRFLFTPDPAQPGNWQVRVRQAGHGGIITIPVQASVKTDNPVAASSSPSENLVTQGPTEPQGAGYTGLQKAVMTASVVWGMVGTASFFARRKA